MASKFSARECIPIEYIEEQIQEYAKFDHLRANAEFLDWFIKDYKDNAMANYEWVADTPQTEERCEKCVHFMTNDMGEIWCIGKKTCEKFEPRSDTPQAEERPAGCSKDWSASCTSCERYFSCDYLSGRKTDCGQGE